MKNQLTITIDGLPAWANKDVRRRLEKIVADQVSKWLEKQKPPVMPEMDTTKTNLKKLFDQ